MSSSNKESITKYDPNMQVSERADGEIVWYSPKDKPFHVAGLNWFEQEGLYRRLPSKVDSALPEAIVELASHPTGGQIRFQTDSSELYVRVKLTGPAYLSHMAATGQCGIDCYIGEPGDMTFCWVTIFDLHATEYEASLYKGWKKSMRNVVLNLPLYQGVEHIEIGLTSGATIMAPPIYASTKKVVIYGTSVTQGGCASRPGMLYSNILSRRIPYEFLNLGFSGSGKGEPEVAQMIAQIDNPALIVLDYEGNCVSTELFKQTLPQFIDIIREKHPLVPILVPSRIKYSRENITAHLYQWRMERKAFEQALIAERRSKGDLQLYFHDSTSILGEADFHECTVDGTHPNDLGFLRMANGLESVYKALLS